MTKRAEPRKEPDLSDFEPIHRGPKCSVTAALATLEGEQLEKATFAMTATHIQHSMIARRLTEWSGTKISVHAVGRHRGGMCSCD